MDGHFGLVKIIVFTGGLLLLLIALGLVASKLLGAIAGSDSKRGVNGASAGILIIAEIIAIRVVAYGWSFPETPFGRLSSSPIGVVGIFFACSIVGGILVGFLSSIVARSTTK